MGKSITGVGSDAGEFGWADMAHFVGRLTALKVLKVEKPGMYADGAGF